MSQVLFPFVNLLFIFISLTAQPHMDKLIEMEIEISALQKQLQALEQKVHVDYHQEMVEELSSQRDWRSYEWSSFSQHLESAEAHEESALRDEKIIEAIKTRLRHLAGQMDMLLSH
jgi:transcription initiation factor IIE alpha subunit